MNGALAGVGTASLILVLGFVGSRVLGMARNMVLGSTFGAGPALDAYFAAFRLPDALFQLIAGAALGSAFLPIFTATFTRISPEAAWRLASITLNLFTLLGSVAAGIGFLLAPWLVPLTVPGFSEAQQALTVRLSQIMLVSTVFFCASGITTGVLQARFHFLFPAIAPLLYNLSIIAATLWLSDVAGILGPAIGAAAGAAFHLMIQLPGLAHIGLRYSWSFSFKTTGLAEVVHLMGPRVLGMATIQVNWIITTLLASTLSSGSLAALSYAWAIIMLPLGIIGIAPAAASFPTVAQATAQENWEGYRRTLATGLRLGLFLSVPGSLGLMLLREPLVTLLYQRGAFDVASTHATALALFYYAPGLFAHVALEVLARGWYALRDTKTPLLFALLGLAGHATLSLLLLAPMGLAGLALAMSVATALEAGCLLLALPRRLAPYEWRSLATSLGKTLVATALMGGVMAWLLTATSLPEESLGLLTRVVASAVLGAAVFLAAATLLRSWEVKMLFQRLRKEKPE